MDDELSIVYGHLRVWWPVLYLCELELCLNVSAAVCVCVCVRACIVIYYEAHVNLHSHGCCSTGVCLCACMYVRMCVCVFDCFSHTSSLPLTLL